MSEPVEPSAGWEGLLEPGERLLWQGRPDARIRLADLDLRRAAMGAGVTAFALFWTGAAIAGIRGSGPIAWAVPLFGLFFLGLGLKRLGGDLVWDAYRRSHTWYTLSDRRAYVATELFGRRRLTGHRLGSEVILELAPDGTGSVWFGPPGRRRDRRPGFRHIDAPREVYALARQVAEGAA